MSDFYQAYLNAFSPRVYYNTNTTATTATAVLRIPSSRAGVSGLHAVALGILLILVATLLSITLIKVPRPGENALRLRESTILSHAMFSRHALHNELKDRKLGGPEKVEIGEIWKDTRFSITSGDIVVVSQHKATRDGTPEPSSPHVT
jgi:hypothetical protein